jgi:phosphoglycerate kinase
VLAKARPGQLLLPTDLVLGREFSAETDVKALDGTEVPDGWMGLDVGPQTAQRYAQGRRGRGLRVLERPDGRLRARAVRGRARGRRRGDGGADGTTVVGGGDSAAALLQFGLGPTGSPTSRRAAAPRSSSSRASPLPGVEVLSA